MIENEILTLEDNKDYIVLDYLTNDDNKYVFLVNEEDENDIVVRKCINKEDGEYIVKLNNADEFEEIMYLFGEKHKGDNDEK